MKKKKAKFLDVVFCTLLWIVVLIFLAIIPISAVIGGCIFNNSYPNIFLDLINKGVLLLFSFSIILSISYDAWVHPNININAKHSLNIILYIVFPMISFYLGAFTLACLIIKHEQLTLNIEIFQNVQLGILIYTIVYSICGKAYYRYREQKYYEERTLNNLIMALIPK